MTFINQIRVSKSLEPAFGEGFRNRWKLSNYSDPSSPAIFFGLYNDKDIDALKSHKGKFIVIWGGVDQNIDKFKMVRNFKNLLGSPAYRTSMKSEFKEINYPYIDMAIPFKNFNRFKPVPLGDKIYVYKGWKKSNLSYFKWESVIKPLMKHFGEDRFIYTHNKSISEIHNLYKKCFVYIKPNEKGGSTTMWELGHMGISTLSNNQGNFPNIKEYKNIKDLINLINIESEKIGSIQYNISELTKDSMMNSNDWLSVEFWENNIII